MAKINGIHFSDDIPRKYTREEFVNNFGAINCGGCKDLGVLYDKIVKISGVTPKVATVSTKKVKSTEEVTIEKIS